VRCVQCLCRLAVGSAVTGGAAAVGAAHDADIHVGRHLHRGGGDDCGCSGSDMRESHGARRRLLRARCRRRGGLERDQNQIVFSPPTTACLRRARYNENMNKRVMFTPQRWEVNSSIGLHTTPLFRGRQGRATDMWRFTLEISFFLCSAERS